MACPGGCKDKTAKKRAATLRDRQQHRQELGAQAAASGQVGGVSTKDYVAEAMRLMNGK